MAIIAEHISEALESVLEYVGGHILYALQKKLQCTLCLISLTDNINRKCIGKAFTANPSDFLKEVSKFCEMYFRRGLAADKLKFLKEFKVEELVNTILSQFKNYAFNHNLSHFIDFVDHFFNIIQLIVALFANIRIHYELKRENEKKSERNALHRLIHFKNM